MLRSLLLSYPRGEVGTRRGGLISVVAAAEQEGCVIFPLDFCVSAVFQNLLLQLGLLQHCYAAFTISCKILLSFSLPGVRAVAVLWAGSSAAAVLGQERSSSSWAPLQGSARIEGRFQKSR